MEEELCSIKPKDNAEKVQDSINKMLTYCNFLREYWIRSVLTMSVNG